MTVTIPDNLTMGNYALRAVKSDKMSNPLIISIRPEVIIDDVECSKCLGVMTISGAGFAEKIVGTDEEINVMESDRPLNVISWTDTLIKATGARCRGTVTVNSLFGTAQK